MGSSTPLLYIMGFVLIMGTMLSLTVNFLGYTPAINDNSTFVNNTVNIINDSRTITIPLIGTKLTVIPGWIADYYTGLILGFSLIPLVILVPLLIFIGSAIIYSIVIIIRG